MSPSRSERRFAAVSLVLGVAFLARVAGQAVQRWWAVDFLPSQDAWQGSSLPYPVLFAAQLVILGVIALVTIRMLVGADVLAPRWITPVSGFGALYFAVMAARLLLGLAGGAGWLGDDSFAASKWFTSHLPTAFHLVLAAEVLLIARYQRLRARQLG